MLGRLLRADNPSVAVAVLPPAAAAAMVQRWRPSLASDLVLAEAASAPDCAQVEVVSDGSALAALQHGQTVWALPKLGSSDGSGRCRHSHGELGPLGAQPLPRGCSSQPPPRPPLTIQALLEECAAETECRMQRATEAAATQLAAAASVHEASALLLREAQANGLSGRHACRLALEAVLSCHALPLTLTMLALSLSLSLSLRLSLRRALALVPTLTLSRC